MFQRQKKKNKKYPDHTSELARLNKIRGQLNGIMKMISERRYCVDILIQFRAIIAGISTVELAILERHIQNCVRKAVISQNRGQANTKINELTQLLSKRLRGI